MTVDLAKQSRDLELEARIKAIFQSGANKCASSSTMQRREVRATHRRESREQMFHEGQGVRFRKRCKHGSGEYRAVAKQYEFPLTECNERRGKTPHERKLHRMAMAKQVRITRDAFKITW